MNYYEACKILSVNPGASKEDIKKAYLNVCKLYHPDNAGTDKYIDKYNLCQEAYNFLVSNNSYVVINNHNVIKKNKVYGNTNKYAYDHNAYKKKQMQYKKNADEKKVRELNDIIQKSKEIQKQNRTRLEHVDYKSEDDILNQIRWLRVAKIIRETIEADKLKNNMGVNNDSE